MEELLVAGTALRATGNSGRRWLIAVVILSFPAILVVPLHLLYAPGRWPGFLDLPVAWTISLAGMFGGLTTMAAGIVAVGASFQRSVGGKRKVVIWWFVALSLFGCWYIAQVPP
jgi:hypothetical protein